MSAIAFPRLCKMAGIPEPVAEHKFHPTRRWRFDYAWPEQRVALEVQGGLFIKGGGRHSRGPALLKEHQKLNAAAALGYRVLFTTPQQVANGEALSAVQAALEAK